MKLHGKQFLLVLALAITCTCCIAGSQAAAAGSSVRKEAQGRAVTAQDASPVLRTGWQEQDGHRYYYSQEGVMQTGMQSIDGKTYYFAANGIMQTGLQPINGTNYYFGKNGAMKTGWQSINGRKYYFAPKTGKMYTGKKKIGKSYYYFGKNGAMKTGWQNIRGKKYYFAPKTGKMYTKRHKIGKHAYYFSKSGVLQVSKWAKDGRRVYYCGKRGVLQSGWLKKGRKKYYFSPKNNQMQSGWQTIGGRKYYFLDDGSGKSALQQNCIVVTKKGRFYVDSGGVQVTAPEIVRAVNFVAEHTKDSWSADVKLKQCFEALWRNYPYKRYYETPFAQAMSIYANDMFVNRQGNCYRYAASFACIAKVLGFDARVASGLIIARGGGMTPHGFTEINAGGVWYICDANMQRNHPERNSYMCTEETYPYAHTSTARFTLTIRGGKVAWR